MDAKRFWDLIAWSAEQCGFPEDRVGERVDVLVDALAGLPPEDMLGFYRRFEACVDGAWTADLYLAALTSRGGRQCRAHEFLGFNHWLIEQGHRDYHAALADPDSLADVPEDPPWDSEEALGPAAVFAWGYKIGQPEAEIEDIAADFSARLGGDPTGSRELPTSSSVISTDDLRRRLPRLARRFLDREGPS
jgi:hypothetical protein